MRKRIFCFLFSIYFICYNFSIYGNTLYDSSSLLPASNKLINLSNPTTNVIVELEDAPLLEHSLAKLDSKQFLSSTIYHTLEQNLISMQNDIQSQVLNDIDANATFKHSYKNILNGFSAEVASDAIEDIRNLKGVKDVYQIHNYIMPNTSISEGSFSNSPGFYDIPNFNGEGKVIAVLDTGFDVDHELMTLSPDTKYALNKLDISTRLSALNYNFDSNCISDIYKSEKIPFAYDYAENDADVESAFSHGMHIAGILAANKTGNPNQFNGIAPESQLLEFKVFTDAGYSDDSVLYAAIDDAISLNADIINISLGQDAGFSDSPYIDYNTLVERASNAGISIICSAGNINRIGTGSLYNYYYNISDPLATNPDSGVVSNPSVIPSALSVASSKGNESLSSFSSWGVTSDLKLKPDLTASGENIYSTSINNGYGILSGTSVSTPFVTGYSTLLNQYLDTTDLFKDYPLSNSFLIKNLLMNTATPLKVDNTNVPYSPRKQGAGLISPMAALNTKALIYNPKNHEAKIDLGDHLTNSFSFNICIENFSDKSLSFLTRASLLSDSFYTYPQYNLPYFISDTPHSFNEAVITLDSSTTNINEHSDKFSFTTSSNLSVSFTSKDTTTSSGLVADLNDNSNVNKPEFITLDPHQKKIFTVNIQLPTTDENLYKQIFTNGFFLEGYLTFESLDSNTSDLSIPYLGFYGNWDSAPIFDGYIYDSSFYYTNQVAYTTILEDDTLYSSILGTNPYDTNTIFDSKLIAISPNNDGKCDQIGTMINLLRNVRDFKLTITDSNGTIVDSDELTPSRKAYYNLGSLNTSIIPFWGKDLPDGQYYYDLVASIDYDNASEQTLSLPFVIDTQAPELVSSKIITEDDKRYLDVTAKDNHYIMLMKLFNKTFTLNNVLPTNSPSSLTTQRFDISDLDISELQLSITDYAMNTATLNIPLSNLNDNEKVPVPTPETNNGTDNNTDNNTNNSTDNSTNNSTDSSTNNSTDNSTNSKHSKTSSSVVKTNSSNQLAVSSNAITSNVTNGSTLIALNATAVDSTKNLLNDNITELVINIPSTQDLLNHKLELNKDFIKLLVNNNLSCIINYKDIQLYLTPKILGDYQIIVNPLTNTLNNDYLKKDYNYAFSILCNNKSLPLTPDLFKLVYKNNNASINLHSINQVSPNILTSNKTFSDIQSHWCQELIENMASRNLIAGVSATKFAPNKTIKKSEFITLVTRILNSQQIVDELLLTMDNKDWSNNLNQTLSRNEAAEFITKLHVYLNHTSIPAQTSVSYSDINDSNNAKYINYATTFNLLSGYQDGTFKPNKSLSRAEAVKILSNFLDLNVALF